MTEQDLFVAAVQIRDPAAREAYLDRACGTDAPLRQRVAGLLNALGRAGGFLEEPAGASDAPGVTRGFRAQDSAEAPGTVIGPYKLLEQIGEGGFGVVFLAEQAEPVRRKVALKVLKPGMDTRQVVARFEAERQALALMDHPHIAKMHDGGVTASGRPYFVMELVKGTPITEFCDRNHLTPRQRLELFVPVCQAVQHAHQKGVIHRDLKPSNVLVSRHDTTPVVKVIDFGVAKALGQALTDKTLFTGVAQMVGTPLYMSPEQAGMSDLDVDTRSDIYSLGVLLYELLTGTTPFTSARFKTAAYDEIRRIIREEEPPKPSTRLSESKDSLPSISAQRHTEPAKLTRMVRGELDWIVMKALEKDRNRRYETANGFVADVHRYLAGEAVLAVPPSAAYRLRKFTRRNRRALVTVSVLALAAFVGVGALAVSSALVWKANKDLKESVDRERREAYYQRITVAHRELSIDNLAAALRALQECPEDLRGWEWHHLMRLCRVEPLVIRDAMEVNGVAFSPDGERIASAGGDRAVKIWNSRTGRLVQTINNAHTDSVAGVAFHPGGHHVASAGADKQVKVWDLTTGQQVFNGPCDAIRKFAAAYTVAFSPDGRQLAAGSDGVVRVWDWKDGQLLHTFPGHENHSIPVAFSPDGRGLVTGGVREGQKLWDTQAGGPPVRIFPAHGMATALAFSPDGGRLASASFDGNVKLWDATTGGLLQTFLHTGNVDCVAFSLAGRRLASAGEDKAVHIWDAATGREVLGLRGHTGRCRCVAFSPDGDRLASASADGTICFWDATPLRGDEGPEILTFTEPDGEIRSVAFSPDGRTIAAAGFGARVKGWDAQTGRAGVEFSAHTVAVFCLAWQPDGQRMATAGADLPLHTVKVWDARTGREAFRLQAGPENFAGAYLAVAFSPDGRHLVTGKIDGAVQVWDAETGQKVGTLGKHRREVCGVVFSPKGGHLASASGDGEVKLWDATRLDKEQESRLMLRTRVAGPRQVAFSPDGRRLATAGEENSVKVWDVEKGGEPLATLRGHNGDVDTVAFSPGDGRWVASAGEDSAVKVWDSRTGKLVRTFRGHIGLVSGVAFSPDGTRLVSGSRDHTVKVWDLTPLREVPEP